MRHDTVVKFRIKRARLSAWWGRQRIIPVALGVYFGLLLVALTGALL